MPSKKVSQKELARSCADIGPEDGTDPRRFQRKPTNSVPNRKALQLCRQVARTLGSVLASESGDEVLRELIVQSVLPAPNASRLLVTVALMPSTRVIEAAEVLAHLNRTGGRLRSEVAAAIHRRRAPELVFRLALPVSSVDAPAPPAGGSDP